MGWGGCLSTWLGAGGGVPPTYLTRKGVTYLSGWGKGGVDHLPTWLRRRVGPVQTWSESEEVPTYLVKGVRKGWVRWLINQPSPQSPPQLVNRITDSRENITIHRTTYVVGKNINYLLIVNVLQLQIAHRLDAIGY